jgi:GntR family transcriptional regulator, rspAB operon transcriptional repressor
MILREDLRPAFESRRKLTIAAQVHRQLRTLIVTGEMTPNQPISENELALALGVSRTPVREALGKLEDDGLVQIIPQFGTFVSPIVPEHVYSNQFIREALECACLETAAIRCTPADTQHLRTLIERQRVAIADDDFFSADEAMHRTLMIIGGHEHAWAVIESVKLHLDRVRRLAVRNSLKRHTIIQEHETIVAHIAAGDSAAAVAAMRAHLRGVYASINAVMQDHPHFFAGTPSDPRPARRGAQPKAERNPAS